MIQEVQRKQNRVKKGSFQHRRFNTSNQNKNLSDALRYYETLVKKYPYVVLVCNTSFYNDGYWVESKPPVALQGYIIKQHDINNINPLKQ